MCSGRVGKALFKLSSSSVWFVLERVISYGVNIASLHTDHIAADHLRYINWQYSSQQMLPVERVRFGHITASDPFDFAWRNLISFIFFCGVLDLAFSLGIRQIPGFIFHQTERTADNGDNPCFGTSDVCYDNNTRDTDFLGFVCAVPPPFTSSSVSISIYAACKALLRSHNFMLIARRLQVSVLSCEYIGHSTTEQCALHDPRPRFGRIQLVPAGRHCLRQGLHDF